MNPRNVVPTMLIAMFSIAINPSTLVVKVGQPDINCEDVATFNQILEKFAGRMWQIGTDGSITFDTYQIGTLLFKIERDDGPSFADDNDFLTRLKQAGFKKGTDQLGRNRYTRPANWDKTNPCQPPSGQAPADQPAPQVVGTMSAPNEQMAPVMVPRYNQNASAILLVLPIIGLVLAVGLLIALAH